MANKYKMTIDEESNLIESVREKKALFDKRVDGYHKNKGVLWEQIAVKLEFNGLNGEDVQKLWQNLRGQYMAHRRKLRKPSGSAKGNRPFFRHEQAMSFLNDSLGEEITYSNINQSKENPSEDVSIAEENDAQCDQRQQNESNERQTSSDDHRSHTKFNNSKRKMDPFDESILKLLQSEDKDEYASFGNLVAAKLRKIGEKDPRLASQIQHNISTNIYDAELQLL